MINRYSKQNKLLKHNGFLKSSSLVLFLILSNPVHFFTTSNNTGGNIETKKDSIASKAIADIKSNLSDSIMLNPFCMYSLYYSDSFFKETKKSKNDSHRVFQKIQQNISIEEKKRILAHLDELWISECDFAWNKEIFCPIDTIDFWNKSSEKIAHQDAIDLYAPIWTVVTSMSWWIVIIAESWRKENDIFSTSSYKWWNSIIIYNPDNNSFYRYAHLNDIFVKTGEKIEPGTQIWTIGKTWQNAIKWPSHLHFEINTYNPTNWKITVVHRNDLKTIILDAKKTNSHQSLWSDL